MQKHKVIYYGSIFIFGYVFIPLFLAGLSLMDVGSAGFYALWICIAVWLAVAAIYGRKPLVLAFSRVVLDERGITAKVPFRKSVTMEWKSLKRMGFSSMKTTGGLYDQHWLCFADDQAGIPAEFKSLLSVPYPNEHCICMVYSEFAWEMITKYAEKKSYNEVIFKSREMV